MRERSDQSSQQLGIAIWEDNKRERYLNSFLNYFRGLFVVALNYQTAGYDLASSEIPDFILGGQGVDRRPTEQQLANAYGLAER